MGYSKILKEFLWLLHEFQKELHVLTPYFSHHEKIIHPELFVFIQK
jgi:hypothetical protein